MSFGKKVPKSESVADAQSHAPAEAVVGATFSLDEVPRRTGIEGELQRNSLKVVLHATLQNGGDAKTVVDAVAEIRTRTDKPTKVTSNGASPLVDASEIDKITMAEAKVKLNAIVADGSLVGNFTAHSSTATKANTDVLSTCSKA